MSAEEMNSLFQLQPKQYSTNMYGLLNSGLDRREEINTKALTLQTPTDNCLGLPKWLSGKESACNAGDLGSIPGSGRSRGEGNGTHSSILAWEVPWTEEPGGLQSVGSQRVGHGLEIKQLLSLLA